MQPIWLILIAVGILILATILWRKSRKEPYAWVQRQAMLQFEGQRLELEAHVLQAAMATGKPRGLRWVACKLRGEPLYATEPDQVIFYALVAATIRFEAIEGGGMEEVEAVDNLRGATAVFTFRENQWSTDGRVVFNLEPLETCERFQLTEWDRKPRMLANEAPPTKPGFSGGNKWAVPVPRAEPERLQ